MFPYFLPGCPPEPRTPCPASGTGHKIICRALSILFIAQGASGLHSKWHLCRRPYWIMVPRKTMFPGLNRVQVSAGNLVLVYKPRRQTNGAGSATRHEPRGGL